MADLASWLLQQIDEDERNAKAAGGRAWHWSADMKRAYPQRVWETGTMVLKAETYVEPDVAAGTPEHIATWDPARALAECEAKRRIIEADADGHVGYDDADSDEANGWAECHEFVLRLLAFPYADRPGYDGRWLP